MKVLFFSFWLFLALALQAGAEAIEVTDVDGKKITLNRKGGVTAVVYSSSALQKDTRLTAQIFDPFHGRKPFRGIVVVDLRKSVAGLMKGITLGIIKKDLEAEAKRVKPYYVKNGNPGNPREDLGVMADFKGETCVALGWPAELKEVEVIVFGPNGEELGRWQKDKNPEKIRAVVDKALDEIEK